jgi:hypothetical protein
MMEFGTRTSRLHMLGYWVVVLCVAGSRNKKFAVVCSIKVNRLVYIGKGKTNIYLGILVTRKYSE